MATPTRTTAGQHAALTTLDADGLLTERDGRVLNSLRGREWIEPVDLKVGRRKVRRWRLTAAGARAAALPVKPRPLVWPWPRERVSATCYRVRGHEFVVPPGERLWRVLCPASPARPVALAENLAEAIDELSAHVTGCTHRAPAAPPVDRANAVDLDRLTA